MEGEAAQSLHAIGKTGNFSISGVWAMSFISLLKRASEGRRPRNDLALVAVLLDRAGLTPEALAPGAIVLIELPDELHGALFALLTRIFPDRSVADFGGDRFGRDLWLVPATADHARRLLTQASTEGTTGVFVADTACADFADRLVQAGAGRAYETNAIGPAVVETLLAVLFEADVEAPPQTYDVEPVLIATRPSIGAAKEALEQLRRLTEPKKPPKADDADKAAKEIQERMAEENLKAAAAKAQEDKKRAAEKDKKREPPPVRLRDLAGYGDAKTWGMKLARDLTAYKAGKLEWRDIDKGLLLAGPPGCGKTFYARALAVECGVPLIATGYDDWHESSAGDTVARTLKKKFEAWRKQAANEPIIVFIDELDTIGARGEMGNNNGWYGSIIATWLAFLDGAEPRTGIVVIGATNFPERIDLALLRPGRLERTIAIPSPTIADIEGFLRHHLGSVRGLKRAAKACRGRSPAEIAKIAREAREAARKAKRKRFTAADVVAVVAAGREKDPAVDRVVAVHEAGHALARVVLNVPIHCMDVDSRRTIGTEDPLVMTLADIEVKIAVKMAGGAAEEAVFGAVSTGAIGDHRAAGEYALAAIASGLFGPWAVGANPLGDPAIRKQIEAMLEAGLERARSIMRGRLDDLLRLADVAQRERYLDGAEVAGIVNSNADNQAAKGPVPGREPAVTGPIGSPRSTAGLAARSKSQSPATTRQVTRPRTSMRPTARDPSDAVTSVTRRVARRGARYLATSPTVGEGRGRMRGALP